MVGGVNHWDWEGGVPGTSGAMGRRSLEEMNGQGTYLYTYNKEESMSVRGYGVTASTISLAVTALMALGAAPNIAYAQAKGMEAPPSKVEITIKDRQHGYDHHSPKSG
jgi:hypothetical protein